MPLIQKLLLACTVMVQMSVTISSPIGLKQKDREVMKILLGHMETGEQEYVKEAFRGAAQGIDETVVGITLHVKNITEEDYTSACAIIVYLEQHIQPIINITTSKPEDFNSNIAEFSHQFQEVPPMIKKILNTTHLPEQCSSNLSYVEPEGHYDKKVMGYRILHSICEWIRELISKLP